MVRGDLRHHLFAPYRFQCHTRALNAAERFHLGFFMDFFSPVTLSPGQKSTYTRVLNTGATTVFRNRCH